MKDFKVRGGESRGKQNFLLFTLFALLFLESCQPSATIYTRNEQFWEGTGGLEFSFVDENPPEIVYENTPFTLAFDVANQGAHTLTGFLTLSIEEDYMCLVDENNECSTFDAVDAMTLSVKSDIEDANSAIKEYAEELAEATDKDAQQELKEKIQTARKNIEILTDSVAVANPYKTKWFSLEGKSIFNYEGGSDILEYKAKAKSPGLQSEKHDVAVIATACYEYSTVWNQEVCIDTDINKRNIFAGACQASDMTLDSQGAPLAVTSIESHMIPTGTGYLRPLFILSVENKGNGKVINKEKIEHACTATGLESRDYNMIFLKSFVLSSEELMYDFNGYNPKTGKEMNLESDGDLITCSPNPLILKGDGTDTITCILDEDVEWDMFSLNQAPYTTEISVQFDYGYTLSESKEVTIQKILY